MSAYNCGLEPLWDHVVIELAAKETKRGLLHLPDTSSDSKPMQGTIVAVGPGKEEVDMKGFVVGNKVLFRQYAGTEFEREDKKYLVIRAGDVMCKVIE